MRIVPTSPKPDILSSATYPSPPNKDGGDPTFTIPRDYGGKKLKSRVQRTYWSGNKYNAITRPPVLLADWVIAEEVPTAAISFLAYPTRRCFMEDWIQLRVQIGDMTIDGTAQVDFTVERLGKISDDKALFVSTVQTRVTAMTKSWYKEQRNLLQSNDVNTETFVNTSANIMYEVCNTDNKMSFVFTSIRLPAPPNDMKTEDEEYVFRAKIQQGGKTYEIKSPVLRGMRWWAHPDKNFAQPKVNASLITPLIDGEAYFNKCEQMIQGAAATICIAGWGMYMDTLLTAMPTPTPATTGVMLSKLLLQKANAGVQVYIILGEVLNGNNTIQGFKSQLLEFTGVAGEENDITKYNILCESLIHKNIHFKLHKHPLELAGNTLGSIHEKYVVVDNLKAAVGGIDFQPNRYQSQAHDWKMDTPAFDRLSAMRKRYNAGPDTEGKELHDSGKEVKFGVTTANGQATYTLPTYLPNTAERAVLTWLKPTVISLSIANAGNPEQRDIGVKQKRAYYYIYENSVQVHGGWVPEDGVIQYTLTGGIGTADLVWWDFEKPTFVDLDFINKGTAKTYIITSGGNPVNKAMWFVRIPKLVSTIDGTAESGEGMRWHDAGVYVEGDVVKNIRYDFVRRWNLAGEDLGCIRPSDKVAQMALPALTTTTDVKQHNTQVVKTGDYALRTDCKYQGTFDVYKQAIRQARHYIYIENQYFTWPQLGDELCSALEKNPKLQLMVIVPFFTEEAAKMSDENFESMSVWGALRQLIKKTLNQQEMKDRGVRHQQWQQANLINRLRAVSKADQRVGVYVMAGTLATHRAIRAISQDLTDDNGTAIQGAVWRFDADGVLQNGVTLADGKANFNIPADTKSAVLKWYDPGVNFLDEELDLTNAGAAETQVLYLNKRNLKLAIENSAAAQTLEDDGAEPYADAHWTVTNTMHTDLDLTDGTGQIGYTIPVGSLNPRIYIWEPYEDVLDHLNAGNPDSFVINNQAANPAEGAIWKLIADNAEIAQGTTGSDGKVDFTLPVGTLDAKLRSWILSDPPDREHDLSADADGAPRNANIGADKLWYIKWFTKQEGDATAQGKITYTVPAAARKAIIEITPIHTVTYPTSEMIYPHSKLMIVDDTWAIIGSANANGRSFVTDEEINVVIHDRATVTAARRSLWHEHLNLNMDTKDIRTFFATWKATAHPKVDTPVECDPAKVNTVHVVELGTPPEGQEYNGPLSSMVNMGKMV